MPIPIAIPIAMGAASLISGILRNRSRSQTSTSRTSPTFAPEFGGMRDMLLRRMTSRIGQRSQLAQSVGNQQIANTNQVFGNLRTNLANRMAVAGQTGGPQDQAGQTGLDIARGGAITSQLNQLPLIEEQMDRDNIAQGMELLGMGRGSETNTTGTVGGSTAAGIGEGIGDFSTFLGQMYGSGMMGGGRGVNAGPGSGGVGLSGWHRWLQLALARGQGVGAMAGANAGAAGGLQ